MPFSIAPDKLFHFYAGLPLGFALLLSFKIVLNAPLGYEILWSVFILAIVSYGFELFSKITRQGIYDIWDAVATVVGGVVGIVAAVKGFF